MSVLREFLKSLSVADRVAFATRCGTSVGYLRKAISVDQRIGAELCINIERESHGAVVCEELRPDIDWGVIRKSPTKALLAKAPAAIKSEARQQAQGVATC